MVWVSGGLVGGGSGVGCGGLGGWRLNDMKIDCKASVCFFCKPPVAQFLQPFPVCVRACDKKVTSQKANVLMYAGGMCFKSKFSYSLKRGRSKQSHEVS